MERWKKTVSAVLVAAGSSTRMGFDKLSFDLGGETVLQRSIRAFEQDPLVTEIVLVAGKNRAFVEQQAADCTKPVQIVTGGTTRAESAKTACWRQQGSFVAVHDAARPLRQSGRHHSSAGSSGQVRLHPGAVPVKDTIKAAARGRRQNRAGCAYVSQRPTAAPCMRCRPQCLTVPTIWPRWKNWMPKKGPPRHRRLQPVRADRPSRCS